MSSERAHQDLAMLRNAPYVPEKVIQAQHDLVRVINRRIIELADELPMPEIKL